ncbi:MAG: hypothetical protein KDA49_07140 [Rhodospirillaceae bacterium]|nr:hypothetical protein [Rhodospirillaceae bacterium]MCA8932228.1 hypothetical protein [Rhodospirillaceae bacterium]
MGRIALVVAAILSVFQLSAFAGEEAAGGGSLVGRWEATPGQGEDVWVEFRADGTASVGDGDDPPMEVSYVVDTATTPMRLELNIGGSIRRSLMEFMSDGRLRITEPAGTYPASFEDGGYLVFARAGGGTEAPQPPVAAGPIDSQLLIGNWAPENEGCNDERVVMFSNNVVVLLEADGTVHEAVGMWTLEGPTLTFNVIDPSDTLSNAPNRQDHPETEVFTISNQTPDRFDATDTDGRGFTIVRCR